jgi:hypothetical protein
VKPFDKRSLVGKVWFIYEKRARLIRQRSGKDLDNMFGPIVVCIGLAVC